ncbi:biopolymer transporter ExbD [Jiella endophytica]|uniref:Biopolymer transporter ExbD n=1 Tax=Jiella endophytica TaxID=2558362 RepID=A0A4Y8RRT1_9HYPH|nr:biopolymer transporter ExbD [Jiella endophytica]TFF25407.1 biopolymer transporter ExbD [Jiella endophytica]
MPTINVVFLLLLFFLLVGTLAAPEESEIDPARVAEAAGGRLPRPLLTIASDGAIGLDGRALARRDLAEAVGGLRRPESAGAPTLYVLAARDLPAERLVALLAEASAAGARTTLVAMTGEAGRAPR